MYTVLERAIKDIIKEEGDIYADAMRWFLTPVSEDEFCYLYSIHSICQHLEIDLEYLRKKVLLLGDLKNVV